MIYLKTGHGLNDSQSVTFKTPQIPDKQLFVNSLGDKTLNELTISYLSGICGV